MTLPNLTLFQVREESFLIINKLLIFLKGGHWADARNRKAFFEEFAKENGFDSSIASNWYSVTKQQLNASKVFNNQLIK